MKKWMKSLISVICMLIIGGIGYMLFLMNDKPSDSNKDINKHTVEENENKPSKEDTEKPTKPDKKVVVTIDNGPGEGEDRLILVNGKIIAHVFVAEKIYDYKDYYVTIEKETKEDGMINIYKNLIVVDNYSGEKKSYEMEKVEENLGVCIESFDKEKGIVTINTGITTYIFDMNSRSMTEQCN